MATDPKAFETAIKHLRTAMDSSLSNQFALPTLILFYSTIDTMGWLDRPDAKAKSDNKDFRAWASSYLLPLHNPDVTAEDLYAARCGLLHSYSFESTSTTEKKAVELIYSFGSANHQILEIAAQSDPEKRKPLKIELMLSAFDAGLAKYRGDLGNDAVRAKKVYKRAKEKFFRFIPGIA